MHSNYHSLSVDGKDSLKVTPSAGNFKIKVNRSTLLCALLAIVYTASTVTCASLTTSIGPGRKCAYCVQGLSGEPDYRAVKLTWKYLHSQEPPAFRVKYCEISQWQGKVRCRQKLYPLSIAIQGSKSKWIHLKKNVHLSNEEDSSSDSEPSPYLGKLIRLEKGSYQAAITDLRMNTNYTINVEADFYVNAYSSDGKLSPSSDDSNLRDFIPYQPTSYETFPIMVETKGFAGKTIRCLGNQSEVVVNTGPYFNGKIFVEGATDESCIVHGNKSSSLQVYTIKINHQLCGSKIVTKDSSVETMIMVHENREILTHNSRRFLVVCQFNPETYTFTASVDVPSHLLKRKKMTSGINSNVTIGSSGSGGPTGTKPLTNSKEYSLDEKLVSSFHEYATAVTSPSPSVYSRVHGSSGNSGSGTSSLLNNRDSRSNIFKLPRLPLHPVTRASTASHSHNETSSPHGPINLHSVSSSLTSSNDEPNYVESTYRSSDYRNLTVGGSRDSRLLSSIKASNYNRNILSESESSPIDPPPSSKNTSPGNNELYGHLILASTVFFTSTLAMAVCYFKCTEKDSERKLSHENVSKFNDQVEFQRNKLNVYHGGDSIATHPHKYNSNLMNCQVAHYQLPFSERSG